jgi:hypothetical protein
MFYHLKNLILESPFSFKRQWRVTKAAELTFQAMKNMMALPEKERKIVLPVLEGIFLQASKAAPPEYVGGCGSGGLS